MLARIIKEKNNYYILYIDGTMSVCTKREFNLFMKSFQNIQDFSGGTHHWDLECKEMNEYKGTTIAQVNDDKSLTIFDITPFEFLFTYLNKDSKDISATEYAKKHGKSVEQIKVLCRNNKIAGARKFGRDWLIPENSPYPEDGIKNK